MNVKCDCGNGFKVLVTYPNSPGEPTPCCSCTIAKYELLYGPATFVVTPVKSA